MDHFKAGLVDYLDYYNTRHRKAKLEGLPPAHHRLQTLSAAQLKLCLAFGGQSVHTIGSGLFPADQSALVQCVDDLLRD